MASTFDKARSPPRLTPLALPSMDEQIPFGANRPDVQDAVNAAHERLGQVTGYLRDAVRETQNFRKAGLAMAKASEDLSTFLMDAEYLEAPLRTEAFFSEESRGESGIWGSGGSIGGGGGGASDYASGATSSRSSNTGERERLLGSLTPILVQFGRLLREQAAAQSMFMDGLQKSFVEPMESYTRGEYGELADNKKVWETAEEVYVAALEKYLHGPMKSKNMTDEVIDLRAAELAKAHRDAQQARFEVVRELSVAEGSKYLVVADCVLSSVNVIGSYFRESTSLVETYAPYKRALEDQTERIRGALAAADAPWKAQKAKLDAAIALSKETLEVTRKAAGLGSSGHSGGGGGGGSARPVSASRVSLKGLEGGKLTAALLHAAATAEARHLCFDHMRKVEEVYARRPTPGCVKEGYLFKKSSSKMLQKHWNRRWFVLDGSKLYYLKDAASRQKMLICDVKLCTVKEVHMPDALYCFEVYSANRRSYLLQAEGPDELKSWVISIRRTIESQLTGSIPMTGMTVHSDEGGGGGGGMFTLYHEADTSDEEIFLHRPANGHGHVDSGRSNNNSSNSNSNPIVQEVMRANPVCTDCSAPSPDWVSLNLGVLICIQCSGIHRSLGTHVSKVRSLGLDALDEVDLSVVREVGNARSNAIWEHALQEQEGWVKPTPDSPAEHKRRYIQAKYVWKGFVEGSNGRTRGSFDVGDGRGVGADRWSLRLSDCAAAGDLAGAVEALAHGGDPRWANPEDQDRTALHRAAETGALGCCEFLLQNGADVMQLDERQCSPLDVAVLGNQVRRWRDRGGRSHTPKRF
ncbi:unnamed protein product, partial [Ascophyllum nodosum]